MSSSAPAWDDVINKMSAGEQTVIMAIAILRERIESLPEDDKKDLSELVLELLKAQNEEEKLSVWTAMREILSQKPVASRPISLEAGRSKPIGKAKNWAEYIGKTIRQFRKDRNWTQAELAQRAGIPQSHVCRIELAEYTPTYRTLEKIAKAFGLDVHQIDPSSD